MSDKINSSSQDFKITKFHCHLYRFVGFLLLLASLINLFTMIRYFIQRYHNRKNRFIINRLSPIIIGMLISSILVISTGIPLVVIQCFICRPFLSYEMTCKIHGFMCFATGLFNMYIVAFLSFVRYLSVLHKTSWLNRLLEQRCDLSVSCCALLAFSWAFPSLFGFGTHFVREGVGFYCSLDWNNSSIQSRIFLISLIIFNYVIPFILLVYSNLRVYCTLRRLLKSRNGSKYFALSRTFSFSKSSYLPDRTSLQIDRRKCLSDARLKETTNRLQRLKIDRRYAWMTAVIAIQYLVAWTPYACIELLNLTGRSTFVRRNPFLPTFCALLAKLSLILNPIILIYTKTKWKQDGITIAGGNGRGNRSDQVTWPRKILIDDDQTVYIVDGDFGRIVKWESDAKNGQTVASGNGNGNKTNQLKYATGVIIDKENNSLIICDKANNRVMLWSLQNNTTDGTCFHRQ